MTTPNTLAKLAAELAQLASEGPALIHTQSGAYISQKLSEAAKALAAQALPAAEPVAWAVAGEVTNWARDFSKYRTQHYVRPVYTAPQATQQAAQAHCGKCDECGKDQADGWALYCVGCLEKTGLLAKEALPNAQHVSSTAADLTGPNDTAAQATTGAAATGGGVTTGAPSEPFGYFKAQPFGWTDCAEDDDGAVALYERPQQAEQAPALTDHEIETLAHRMCWRYKRDGDSYGDPAYTFNKVTLIDFVRRVGAGSVSGWPALLAGAALQQSVATMESAAAHLGSLPKMHQGKLLAHDLRRAASCATRL